MAAINNAVGMMDDAYFVGRKVILDWLNDLCQLKLAKIEETASGAVACQVMDALFPGKVPMSKVNWGAKTDYEYVANYKILQSVFDKLKVDKRVDVDKLIRARYQDNLEFMQWLRKFYEMNNNSSGLEDYDAVSRRNRGKNVQRFKPAMNAGSNSGPRPKPSGAVSRPTGTRTTTTTTRTATTKPTAKPKEKENAPPSKVSRESAKKVSELESQLQVSQKYASEMESKFSQLEAKNAELKLQVDGCERERDFYFGKLREVEILLQDYEGPDKHTVRDVLKVLYATEDDVDGEAALAAAEAAMAGGEGETDEKQNDDEEEQEVF